MGEKVDGSKLAYGELSKKELHQQEMIKAFAQDPQGMEKAIKQAQSMKQMSKAGKSIKNAQNAVPMTKEQAQADHVSKLEEACKKTGMNASVFSGADLTTAGGMARFN